VLVDVRPPYGVSEIAAAAGLAPGYVSRLLDTLDRAALVERARRGRVEDVDIAGLVRRWAESYDVLKTNEAFLFLAPSGAREALSRLAECSDSASVAVTGSFAAVRLAPVAVPALLIAYSNDVEAVAEELGLLPADEGPQTDGDLALDSRLLENGVGTVPGSSENLANMKELRAAMIRVLFAFDPTRTAILLIGGDKRDRWQEFYAQMIPLADNLFDEHLKELESKGTT
jgi:hypothetical protein